MELFLEQKDHTTNIVSQEEWSRRIKELENQCATLSKKTVEEQKKEWLNEFEKAIMTRVAAIKNNKNKKIGLFFSGGVDCTIIALLLKKNNVKFTCYTTGFKDPKTKDPEDIIVARKIAKEHGLFHKERVLALNELGVVVDATTKILGADANPISVGVGAVVVAAAELARADGVTVFFTGLGSEEIFAGYKRHMVLHQKATNKTTDKEQQEQQKKQQELQSELQHECWRGTYAMYERDLVRDCKVASALQIDLATPFLDPAVIISAMRMPAHTKIHGEDNKYILRVIAEEQGLAHAYAFRKKRAAQYGSRINKGILRLAWQEGLTKKGEYLERVK